MYESTPLFARTSPLKRIIYALAVFVPCATCVVLIVLLTQRKDTKPPLLEEELLPRCAFSVPVAPNSTELIIERRARLLAALPKSGIAYLRGGTVDLQYQSDTELKFRQRSNFYYATGVTDAGCHAVLDLSTGQSYLFVPNDPGYAIWNGRPKTLAEYQEIFNITHAAYVDDLNETVSSIPFDTVFAFAGEAANLPFEPGAARVDTQSLINAFGAVRMVKSAAEVGLMRLASSISSQAHVVLMQQVKRTQYEYHLQELFEYVTGKCGCSFQGYLPIVGAGENAALLHYNTNLQPVLDGELVLVDAGADFAYYVSDITRTWPASGKFNDVQRDVYNVVLEAQLLGIELLLPGASYRTIAAEVTDKILGGLFRIGLVTTGNLTQLKNARIPGLFMPHGLGHHVGIDVHDHSYPTLYNVPMQSGMVVTIEPGVYFNPYLFEPALNNSEQAPLLNAEGIRNRYTMGGVRIEDVVLVTDKGHELLSNAPKLVAEIEAAMAAAKE